MEILKKVDDKKVVVKISGRLDTQTAPELEKEIITEPGACGELILDLSGLEYISSAGLRVILKAQKLMNTQGIMKLTGVNESVMEVLEITGFSDIVTIE